LKNTSVLNT